MKKIKLTEKGSKEKKIPHSHIPISVLKNQSNSSQNDGLQQRHFYQCFCACNYQSYSALYLHVKIKHNQNLSFKSLKKQTTEWSGSIKNIYFEFVEDEQDAQKNSIKTTRKLRQRVHKTTFKDSSSEISKNNKKQDAVCKKQFEMSQQKGEKNVIEIFKIYELQRKRQGKKVKKRVLDQLIQFINENYEQIIPQPSTFQNYCMDNSCELIPLLFNNFFQSKYLDKAQKQQVIQLLINLSDWLYSNGFSQLLIVGEQQYDRFICKLQQKQHSVIIKNEAREI